MKQPVTLKIRAILLIVLATFSLQVWGVDCSSTDITLYTQDDVDNFQATYGGGGICDRVIGTLSVEEGGFSDIDGLINLTFVGGDLSIGNNYALTNLDGLSNLAIVGGNLNMYYNEFLTDLDGLSSLTDVGGWLNMYSNAVLTNLDGLSSLTSVGSFLIIRDNAALTNLNGLSSLSNVGGDLSIGHNAVLTNFDGLSSLSSVGGYLRIYKNDALSNISGLSNLSSVGGPLLIGCPNDSIPCSTYGDQYGNAALTNIDGLVNLTSVGGNLRIHGNAVLTNVDGLSSLTSVGGYYLTIGDNAALENLDGLSSLSSVVSAIEISSNYALTNIDGLSNLTNISVRLDIHSNSALTNVDGLTNLNSLGSTLEIYGNAALTNIDGLSNLTTLGGGLDIHGNAALSSCSALAFLLGWPGGPPDDNVGGSITVSSNKSGCNSVQEILDSVSGPTAPPITASEAMNGQAVLTFSPATTTDILWPIIGYQAQCLADQSVFENSTVMGIPDLGSVVSPLTVSGVPSMNAAGINIPVNITHPRTRHLTLILTSPSGTSVMLWDEAVGDGTDLIGTFPTTLEPAESLAAFDGEDFNGEWQLTVADGVATQTGTLNSWGITIQDKVNATTETSPVTVIGLTNFQVYSCTVSAITGLGVGPPSSIESVTYPLETHTCRTRIMSGVSEYSDTEKEACELLVVGEDYIVEEGVSVSLSGGREIWFMPDFLVKQGATLEANVCGQSLCEISDFPMPLGCHSCVDLICASDASCCDTDFDQVCLDMVDTVCGLVCE